MGMFDSFRMPSVVFPDGRVYADEFQTKGLQCRLDEYVVTGDGRVVRRRIDRDEKFYHPTNLTATVILHGPVSVKAVFAHGRLVSLDMEEPEHDE